MLVYEGQKEYLCACVYIGILLVELLWKVGTTEGGRSNHTGVTTVLFSVSNTLVNGQWSMINGQWSMVNGQW